LLVPSVLLGAGDFFFAAVRLFTNSVLRGIAGGGYLLLMKTPTTAKNPQVFTISFIRKCQPWLVPVNSSFSL